MIPAIAADEEPEHAEPAETWSREQQDQAEKALFDRLAREEKHPTGETGNRNATIELSPIASRRSQSSTWRHVWMLYAAGILLF